MLPADSIILLIFNLTVIVRRSGTGYIVLYPVSLYITELYIVLRNYILGLYHTRVYVFYIY